MFIYIEEMLANRKCFAEFDNFLKHFHMKSIYSNELLVRTKTKQERKKRKEGEAGIILTEECFLLRSPLAFSCLI